MYLFGFLKTRTDRVSLVPLGTIGFSGLTVIYEVMGLGELVVCGSATVIFLVIWCWLV